MGFEQAGWELSVESVKRNEVLYDCCPDVYVDVTYTLKLKRSGPMAPMLLALCTMGKIMKHINQIILVTSVNEF